MKKLLISALLLCSQVAFAATTATPRAPESWVLKRGSVPIGTPFQTLLACEQARDLHAENARKSGNYSCDDIRPSRVTWTENPVTCDPAPAPRVLSSTACGANQYGGPIVVTENSTVGPAPACVITRTQVTSGTCTDRPASPTSSQTASCPAGTTGSYTQTRTVTWNTTTNQWVAGAWTPTTAPAGACTPVVTNPPPTGTGPTYYFSDCQTGAAAGCVAGSNSNPGTSEAAPKQNLSGFNVNTVPAGTRILFKRGGAWANFRQVVENLNASAANPLVFDAYGTGPDPLLRTASENMFILGGNWQNTSNDGGYVIRNLKLDGQGTATWGIWFLNTVRDVIVENNEITGFGIAINSNDSATHGVTGITLRNNLIQGNRAMGMLGHYNNILIEGNTFRANATGSTFDHGSYIGGGNNITLRNNLYDRNSTVNGVCSGGNMTFHGQIDGLLVEGNTIVQDSATPGCWLMSVTQGYTSAEWFRNAIIRNNKLINGGNTAMAVQSAPGVLVEGNVVINTNATSQSAFSIGSGPGPYADGDSPDSNATVRNNTVCRPNAGASGSIVNLNSPGGTATNNVLITGTAATTGACAR